MKKLFLVLLFSAVLFIGLPTKNVKADAWVLPFDNLEAIVEIIETIMSGGEITFSEFAQAVPVLDDIVDYMQEENAARQRGAIMLQSMYNNLYDRLSELARENLSSIDANTEFILPIGIDDIAAFTRYDMYWYKYNAAVEADPPASSVINVDVFSWPYSSYSAKVGINYNFSFQAGNSNLTFYGAKYPAVLGRVGENNGIIVGCDLTSSNSGVVVNLSNFSGNISSFNVLYPGLAIIPDAFYINNGVLYLTELATDYLLNGVIRNPGFIEVPDIIQIGDTGQETYDVYGLTNPTDLGIDVPSFIDWLIQRIGLGDMSISMDDVIEDSAPIIKTRDGSRTFTDDDAIAVEKAIRNRTPKYDPEDPSGTPTPTPDIGYPWPKFPIIDPTWEPGNGSTVLSEIIDATQQTIPSELMTVIWGTFSLLVVGGLITILHK